MTGEEDSSSTIDQREMRSPGWNFDGKLLTKVIPLSGNVPARLGGQIKFIMEGKWKMLMVVVFKSALGVVFIFARLKNKCNQNTAQSVNHSNL